MARYQGLKTRPPVFWPMLLTMHAGVCALTGRAVKALSLLDEAAQAGGMTPGNVMASDLCRLRAEMLLTLSPENMAEAESLLLRAVDIARNGQAALLELRAATSLGRLYERQGRVEAGRGVLQAAYEKMTEGFTTADVREAEAQLMAYS